MSWRLVFAGTFLLSCATIVFADGRAEVGEWKFGPSGDRAFVKGTFRVENWTKDASLGLACNAAGACQWSVVLFSGDCDLGTSYKLRMRFLDPLDGSFQELGSATCIKVDRTAAIFRIDLSSALTALISVTTNPRILQLDLANVDLRFNVSGANGAIAKVRGQ